jgi:nucleotide-binding universal stress UspA family protein
MNHRDERAAVLVGVDDSPWSTNALRWAARLGAALDRPVEVVAVSEAPATFGWSALVSTVAPDEEMTKAVTAAVDEVFGENLPADLRSWVVPGAAAATLVRLSRDASVLVVGRRGHGGFAGLALGSVSAKVAEHAHCPVLVVPAEDEHAGETAQPPRIVVGVDGSESSKEALRWAARLAQPLHARIDAVTLWDPAPAFGWGILPPTYSPGIDLQQRLDEIVDETFPRGRPAGIRAAVLEGPTAATLLEVAQGAVLLVVGSRGLGGFPGLRLGSVSAKVAAHSSGPTLIVHS